MACHGCATKFGFFEKEHGCPNCGFAYCKKCLRYEAKDPKKEGSTRKVCVKCHIKLAEMELIPDDMDKHVDKFRKCIETMCETDSSAKYNFKDPKYKFPTLRDAFDYETQQLADRVKKLDSDYKKTWPKLETEEELRERLNKIQGKPSSSKESDAAFKTPVSRTAMEEANQLLQQFTEEEALNKHLPKPEIELEARLARLRGKGAAKISTSSTKQAVVVKKGKEMKPSKPATAVDEDELPQSGNGNKKGVWGLDMPEYQDSDEETAAQSIVKKALLDAQLEAEEGNLELADLEEQKEFPWCVICNENATQRCIDCDGDLYCDACFTECCKPEDHLSEPFICKEESVASKES